MGNKHADRWIAGLLLAFSLLLRIWDIAGVQHYVGDQNTVVSAAYRFPETGMFSPDSWEQPPLHYYLIRLSTFLFGDNAYGWRMKNVLLGSLTVPLLYLLGLSLSADRRIALLASLFLLFDPLHLYYSRTIFGEISSLPFFLGAVLISVRHLAGRTDVSPVWAGVLLGLALAQKWYYVIPLVVLVLIVIRHRLAGDGRRWREVLHVASLYGILPFIIYVLSFTPWFLRGYSLPEFLSMQVDAYHVLQTTEFYDTTLAFFRAEDAPAWKWFLRPILLGYPLESDGIRGRALLIMNNTPVWIFTFPSIFALLYRSWRERSLARALPALLFLATYLQMVAVDRAIFLYSALVLLPFAFIPIAHLIVSLLNTTNAGNRGFWYVTAAFAAWGLYLAPLVLGRQVSFSFYAPIFTLLHFPR